MSKVRKLELDVKFRHGIKMSKYWMVRAVYTGFGMWELRWHHKCYNGSNTWCVAYNEVCHNKDCRGTEKKVPKHLLLALKLMQERENLCLM